MYHDEEVIVPHLKLRTFSVHGGAYGSANLTKLAKNVTSIINSSCSTLEELNITNYGSNYNLDVNNLPKLKTFETRATSADLVKTIIKSSFKTLSVLKLDKIQHPENVIDENFTINIVKKCQLKNVHPQFALSIINSVKHSLEVLEVHHTDQIERNQLKNMMKTLRNQSPVKIRKLKLVTVQPLLALGLMHFVKNTLKNLVIEGIDDSSEIRGYEMIEFFHLEKFSAIETDERLMSRILKSASKTLQEITLENIISTEEVFYNDLILPQLKRFSVDRTKFDIVKSVLKSLQSPLEMLAITGGGDMDNTSLNTDLLALLLKFGANNPDCFLRVQERS